LPRKALADVGGKPLLLHIVARMQMATTVDEIVICTTDREEDKELLRLADDWGVSAVAGNELDLVSRFLLAAEKTSADIVLRVTGDNIFTDPENVDRMVREHIANDAEYTRTSGMPLGLTAEVMSVSMLPRLYDVIPDITESEYLMVYAFDPERFRCLVLDAPADFQRPYYSVTVDTQEDLELVRQLYSRAKCAFGPDTAEIIQALDQMPGVGRLNSSSPIKMPGGVLMTYDGLLKELKKRSMAARQQMSV